MPERNESADSFDEFFSSSKIDNDDNNENKPKQNDLSPTSAVAALIKSQPVVHRRQTPSEPKQVTINSKKTSLTTNAKNTPATSKHSGSSPSKIYESDFDDNASLDNKKKHSSLPPPKQRTPETDRRRSDSKLKTSFTIANPNKRRKERFLPYIHSKTQPKRRRKEPKNDFRQRVLSAQNDKLNQLQSRLAVLRRQLEDERIENKTLRSIQKREEKTLKKYEDQEYDVHLVAKDYTCEIEAVKEKITTERDVKVKLEKELEERDGVLRDQTKRMKFFEKLIHEQILDEPPDELREKLKEADKKVKKYQDKITNKEKHIESLEKNYRHEIHQELVKQRELKQEIENHSKKYTDLLLRLEDKSRQVGTMHIYIQRGGRRPSISSSVNLTKSRSLQSLQDTSPRFREKMFEYDKKRREENKLKPKPKPLPLPSNPPPKPERKKYIPSVVLKPQRKKPLPHTEKPPIVENEPKGKPPVRRLSTPHSIDEDKSEIEDEIIIEPTRPKSPSPSPSPIPTRMIQRSEQKLPQARIHRRSLTPVSLPTEPKLDTTTTSNPFKHVKPPSPLTREFDEKWPDTFDTNKKEESAKDDLLSKLMPNEQQEKKVVPITQPSLPSSQRSSMIMFEPTSITTNGYQSKPPTRITSSNVYDFDQAVINLHDGKPVTTPPTTTTIKTSVDTFESLFDNKTTNLMNGRDDTFTTTQEKSDPIESLFSQSSSAVNNSTPIKPTIRQIPSQNDKLQRPKVVTNVPRPIPNRTVVEEIEEFVL